MINKIFKNLINSLIFIFLSTASISQEITFEAENIETVNENIISATNNVIITDSEGGKIFGNNLLIDKNKKIFTISNNVVYKDLKNLLTIKTDEINFYEISNIINTSGLTTIEYNNKYLLEGKNITFDKNENKIFSSDLALIKDKFDNQISFEEYNILLDDQLLTTNKAKLTDKELNIYQIDKLYYDYDREMIVGKDVEVNIDNEISSKKFLPRIKSRSLEIDNGISKLEKSVYTNCKKRKGCPPWVIQAEEVSHDKKKKQINYKNAFLKLYDIPVLYFPKFFHPDPTIKRQSGFLTPTLRTHNKSSYLRTPYFFAISENSDFTFSPRFYENSKNIYQGEYRYVTKNSKHVLDASILNDSPFVFESDSSKTHFFLNSSFELEKNFFENSKIDIKLENVSNDAYLKSNDITSPIINSQNTLKSTFNFEGSRDDLEFSISAEVYDDLNKEKSSDKYEYIFPSFNISKNLQSNLDGTLTLNNIGFNKLYDTNVSEKILVNNLSYESMDTINSVGLVNNYEIILKNFNSDSNNSSNYKNKKESDLQGLFQFNSKLPLRKIGKNFDSLLTPIFVAKFNPSSNRNIKNSDRIVDYSNIFSSNRLSSNETLEGGESVTIGNEFKLFRKSNLDNEIFGLNLATSFRNEENSDLPIKSSLGQKTSNIVGQMTYKGSDLLQLDYDFFADNNLGKFNYHKFKSTFKVNNFVSSFEFIEENNNIGQEHFVSNETSYNLDENKSLLFRTRKNKKTNLTEYYDLIYQYKIDCLVAGIEYKKNYYNSGGLRPDESIFFSITFMPFENKVNLPGLDK